MPQDKILFYHGSQTKPSCDETVSWFVNTVPFVITTEEISEFKALLN